MCFLMLSDCIWLTRWYLVKFGPRKQTNLSVRVLHLKPGKESTLIRLHKTWPSERYHFAFREKNSPALNHRRMCLALKAGLVLEGGGRGGRGGDRGDRTGTQGEGT